MSDAPGRPADGASRARRWGPLLAWTTILLVATSWPNPNVPDVRDGDKVVHVLIYAVLAFLAVRAWWPAPRRPHPIAVVGLVLGVAAFGWADEWHQQFIPGRGRSTADWYADTVGAVVGTLAALIGRRRVPSFS